MRGRGGVGERRGSHVVTWLLLTSVNPQWAYCNVSATLSLLYSTTILQYVSIYVSASNQARDVHVG